MASCVSVEDLMKGIPDSVLGQVVSEVHLSKVSTQLTTWQLLRPYLNLTPAEEDDITKSFPADAALQKLKFLQKWSQKYGPSATYRVLIKAVFESGKVDTAHEICKLLTQSPTAATEPEAQTPRPQSYSSPLEAQIPRPQSYSSPLEAQTPRPQRYSSPLEAYEALLRESYRDHHPVMVMEWPPPPTLKFFNLAVIKQKTVERGQIRDEFIRQSLHRNIDDILKRKEAIEVEQLFSLDDKKRKVILIEGAPGSGKSTFLWHICCKWQAGELFQQFSLVLLVTLRDTAVHYAKSVADILPFVRSKLRDDVVSELEHTQGRGVLILLDGWDEAPARLREDNSFFFGLIKDPHLSSLERATIVISSRPSASRKLRAFVSSRVEVLGFTERKREEYIVEAISNPGAAQELLAQIKHVPQLGENCHLPLNLVIITHTFLCMGHKLPSTYCRIIITLALNCLLRHIQKTTSLSVEVLESFSDLPDSIASEFNALCKLAYNKTVAEQYTFRQSELARISQTPKKKSSTPRVNTLGLLQAVHSLVATGSSTVYHFLHLSLQELCAAYHIASLHTTAEQIAAIWDLKEGKTEHHLRFHPVCLFYSALTSLVDQEIVECLAEANQGYSGSYADLRVKVTHAKKPKMVTNGFPECVLEAKNPELSLAEIIFDEPEQGLYETTTMVPIDFEDLTRIINLKVIVHKLVIKAKGQNGKDNFLSIVRCISTNTARVQNIDMEFYLDGKAFLYSGHCKSNAEVLEELAMGLSANTTLKHFSLQLVCYAIDDVLLDKLALAAQENETLTSITIVVETQYERTTITPSVIDVEFF